MGLRDIRTTLGTDTDVFTALYRRDDNNKYHLHYIELWVINKSEVVLLSFCACYRVHTTSCGSRFNES